MSRPDASHWCGPLAMTPGALYSHDPAGGLPALFDGRRVSYSFNTRVAIRRACDLLGLAPGDEVLAPAYNCGSELDPLLKAGLKVTLYPVDRQGVGDPAAVSRLIGPRTRAVYVTHYFGFPQPAMAALRRLCDDNGLSLIEDCALSLMSAAPADGRTGDVAVFCFYKFFPTLAGGALVINAARIGDVAIFAAPPPWAYVARPALRMTLDIIFGARRIATLRARLRRPASDPPDDTVSDLPDMPAGYYFDPRLRDTGMARLTRRVLPSFNVSDAIANRRANYRRYIDLLGPEPEIVPLFGNLPDGVCPHSMAVLIPERDMIARALQERGIPATAWWSGYNQFLDWKGQTDARYLKDNVLSLPLHQSLGAPEIEHIVNVLKSLVARHKGRGALRF